jgi:hypothetical protein
MRIAIATTVCLLMVSAGVRADPVPPAAAQPASAQAAPPVAAQPVVLFCRAMIHEGMLLRTRDCRTREEWDKLRRDGARGLADFQNRSYVH